jgi:hypothetical protein
MKTPTLLCAVGLLALGCKTDTVGREDPAAPPKTSNGSAGKPQAPVEIEADVGATSASVRVRFAEAGSNVDVRVNGVDGLSLPGGPMLATGRSFAAGETAVYDVPLTPGPGQGMLSVHVSGTFPNGQRTAVRAFLVGKPAAGQPLKADPGTTTVGGEPVKLVPVDAAQK